MAIRVSNITVIDDSRNIVNVDNIGIGTTGSSGTLQIGAGTSAFVVTDVGFVGIGTTNPETLLHVTGTTSSRVFTVSQLTPSSNIRVGIGTTNPEEDLHIKGSNASMILESTANNNNGSITFIGKTAGTGIAHTGGINFRTSGSLDIRTDIYRTGTNQSIVFQPGGIESGRFDSGGNFLVGSATSTGTASQPLQVTGGAYVSTRLGVGVTNPAANTQVAIAGTLGISEVGGAGTRTLLSSGGSGFILNHNDNSQITFQTLGTNRLTYSHSSNFWTIPAGIPFLVGTASSTGTASQLLQVTGGAYVSGNLGVGVTNPGAKLVVDGDVRLAGLDAEIEFNTGGARLKGRTNALSIHTGGGLDTETSEQVRINTTGVGIGTTNPTVALQLSPTASISNVGSGITLAGTVGSALTVAQFLHFNTNTSYLRIKATRNAAGSDWTTASTKLVNVTDVTEQGYIEFNPNGAVYGMAFGQGGSEWARFLQSGNLGIGTTNPQAKLDVVGGSMRIISTSYPAATYGTNVGRIQFGYQDAFDGAELSATTNAGAGKKLYLNATGNGPVLVNTFTETGTASQSLQVSGGAYVSGSVGIGITNPGATLQVYNATASAKTAIIAYGAGDASFQLTAQNGVSANTSGSELSRFGVNYSGIGWNSFLQFIRGSSTQDGSLAIYTNNSERVRIDSTGDVGIGTTNPTAALTIGSVGIASDGNSQIYLNGATSNRIDFNNIGGAAPTTIGTSGTTRSPGTKIVLYPGSSGSQVDYGFGIESSALWSSSGGSFKWYGGTVGIATLSNTGNLSITGEITATAADFTGVGIASDGNSQIYLNGATSNRIDFNVNGLAAPTTVGTSGTTRSAGTKIVLYPTTTNDYAIGMESSHIWSSIPAAALGWKWYAGTVGVATLGVAGGLTLSGGLTVGTNSNIVGDFSNATLTARTYFISKTTNGFTAVGAIPNGTSTTSAFYAINNSTPTNASYCGPVVDSTAAYLRSSRTGTGAFLPLYIETTETTRVAITTTGNVGIGITNPGSSLQVAGPSAGVRITNDTGLVGNLSSTGWLISQASSISAIPPASALTISNGSVTALTALTTGRVGINTTDAGSELDVQGNIFIRDTAGSATFTSPGNLAIKDTTSNPFISFHAPAGARQSYIQSASSGFLVVQETAIPLRLRTELTSPIEFETAAVRRVAISTGGETEFFKGIHVAAGIATIPTVSVTATTASTSTTTGALIVAGGVGVAATVHVGGDVDYRRSAATVVTATYTGTPANIAAISAVGNIGVVTFATAGIAATINVTGMLPGQILELFVTNPTTAKVLTIQYNTTAIAGVGIASASPAQGASFAANGTRLYRFIAATNNPAVVAGDIKVVGTT